MEALTKIKNTINCKLMEESQNDHHKKHSMNYSERTKVSFDLSS